MPRIRTLKPEIWLSPQVMRLSHGARLLFIGLITLADDEGRGTADVRRLKAALFGADDGMDVTKVEHWLQELATQGLSVVYDADKHGSVYQLLSWKAHQKIDKPKPSRYPAEPKLRSADTSSMDPF